MFSGIQSPPLNAAPGGIVCQSDESLLGTCVKKFKTYMCVICGFMYDEEKGLPEEGIAPGTSWEDVPLNWACPDCGATKSDFEMIEV
jgi:rubredoxin